MHGLEPQETVAFTTVAIDVQLSSQQPTKNAHNQHDQVQHSKGYGCEQSLTSARTSTSSERRLVDSTPSPNWRTPFPVKLSPQLSETILSKLYQRYPDQPLPISQCGPPTTCAPIPKEKLRWYGSWHEGWQPRWGTALPCEEDIYKTIKPIWQFCGLSSDEFTITPFSQGMWNKLYLIASEDKTSGKVTERILRISLPVNPWFKLRSEISTMEYVRCKTNSPIPKVYCFDSSMENPLGFEWMIMERMNGQTFRQAKRPMSQQVKENLCRTIAEWVHQLSELRFDRIGSLYQEWDPDSPNYLTFQLGPATTDHFLGPWRTEKRVSRGPFENEAQLFRSIAELNLADILDPRQLELAKRAWKKEEDFKERDFVLLSKKDDEVETRTSTSVYTDEAAFESSGVPRACFSVLELLPSIETKLVKQHRSYVLHHFDISQDNVLVDDNGAAVALLDWKNVTTASLSQTYPWPSIIDPKRHESPELSPQLTELHSERYIAARARCNTRLAAGAFMERLKELKSSWPQAEDKTQEFISEFEEDLSDLGSFVKEIYAGWAELEVCEKIKAKYCKKFYPISSDQKGKVGLQEKLHQALEQNQEHTPDRR